MTQFVSFSAHKGGVPQGNFPSYYPGDPVFDGSDRKGTGCLDANSRARSLPLLPPALFNSYPNPILRFGPWAGSESENENHRHRLP